MKPTRKLSRRSFFATVAGAAAIGALVEVVGPGEARAQSGCSDSDSGPNGDPGGNGRRCAQSGARTGCTDRDTGHNADRPNYGHCGGGRATGITDQDSGPIGDQPGNGHGEGPRACTDSDTGTSGDPVGRGRRC